MWRRYNWGKKNNIIRIGVINIHGIPKSHSHPKNINIKENIDNYNFDYIGLTETNCYWPLASPNDAWHERTRSWWKQSKSKVTYYKHPATPLLHQPGGVISVALKGITNTAISSGKDLHMGRWSWITVWGKHQVKTTLITVYWPCKNSKGTNTVYSQQLRYLSALQIEVCPRQLWLDDLTNLIQSKTKEGHQIILLGDFNEDVKSAKII